MPPILSTVPRSPDLVTKQCSSQNPYRLICAANDPASFQSLAMSLTLNTMAPHGDAGGVVLHRVVPSAKLAGVQKHAQYLYVVPGCDAGGNGTHDEQADSAEERMNERE